MTELTDRVAKARLEVNTAKLASARAEAALGRGDTVKAKAETHASVLAQRRSIYAIDAMASAVAAPPPPVTAKTATVVGSVYGIAFKEG